MDLSKFSTEELMKMKGAPASGADLSQIPTEELMKMVGSPAPKKKYTGADFATPSAPVEMAMTMGTAIPAALVGGVSGLVKGLFGGKYGTAEGGREAAGYAGEVAHGLTYQPRGGMAQDGLETIGKLLDKSKLAGLGPNEAMSLNALAPTVRPAVSSGKAKVQNGLGTVADLFRKEEDTAMVGMGAASTDASAIRRARAADLPVPVQLTKGQANRDFEQQRFERETAKDGKTGEPLRQRYAKQNEDIIKNFDSWIDETGAQAPSLRATGNAVDDALVSKANFAKAKIRDAYDQARKSGEMAELVDTAPLLQFLSQNSSASKLAPVLSAIENEVVRLGGATRTEKGILFPEKMSLNDVEDMRKLVVRLSKVDETNGHYGGLANKLIDQMTEGKGGDKYAAARQLFKDYAGEFKNQGVIRKLLGTKPGTTDRSVAFEDVFKHSVLDGSMDDTAAVFRSLEGAGPKGKTAIQELKGAGITYLRDAATKNSARDTLGNPILSFDKLNKAVRELERDGKLELIYGKKGAEQIRDITELVADVHTAPPGAINTSNTGAVLLEALGSAVTGHIPTATAQVVRVLKEQVGNRKVNKRVRESLAEPEESVIKRPMMH